MLYLFWFSFIVFMFVVKMKFLLPILICLEFFSLTFFFLMGSFLNHVSWDSVSLMFVLVVVVSESVMGLIIFVLFTRGLSKDYVGFVSSNSY